MKSHWTRMALSDVFSIARGGSPRPIDDFITDAEDGVNWIMIGDASEGEKLISSTKKKIKKEGVSRSRMVYPGDFLLTNSMSFGKPYILNTQGCIHDGWLVMSPKIDAFSSDFFYYLLSSNYLYAEFSKRAAGATVKNLNIDLVKSVEIDLPPLPEQRRIAQILDKAEVLRAKRRAALTKLDTLAQSIFLEMFGDPVSNTKKWKLESLSEASSLIQIGPFGTQLHEEDYIDGGIPLINPTHIKNGKICPSHELTISESKYRELPQYQLQKGDLILGRRGEMGRCAIIGDNENGWLCGTGSLFVRVNNLKIEPVFLLCVISSNSMKKNFEAMSQGQTMANLNKSIVGSIQIPMPPLPLQQAFARRVEAIETLKAAHRASLAKLDALFASLQHRAFRGEL